MATEVDCAPIHTQLAGQNFSSAGWAGF